jgi:hypothetical protein
VLLGRPTEDLHIILDLLTLLRTILHLEFNFFSPDAAILVIRGGVNGLLKESSL